MRTSKCDDVLDLTPRARLCSHESTEPLRCVLAQMAANFRNIEMRRHRRVGKPLNHVKQCDGAVGLTGEIQRKPERLKR